MRYLLALRDVLGAWWAFPVADWSNPIALYRAALRGRRKV
jgi:hypothetical protein